MNGTAHIFIDNGSIKIELPFNSKFVKHFRKNTYNTFIWNKIDKVYETKFNTYALKCAVNECSKFFNVTFCDVLKPVIEHAISIQDRIFEPTLVESNGNYYIACINESLHNQIANVTLDNSLESLHNCTLLSVKVNENIYKDNPAKNFAANKHVTIDVDYLPFVRDWLLELNIKHIYMSQVIGNSTSSFLSRQLIKQVFVDRFVLKEEKKLRKLPFNKPFVYFIDTYEKPKDYMFKADKVIQLTNNKK